MKTFLCIALLVATTNAANAAEPTSRFSRVNAFEGLYA